MNLEKWLESKKANWLELNKIIEASNKGKFSNLTYEQKLKFNSLYQGCSSDLASANKNGINPNTISYLNNLIIKAHNIIYSGNSKYNFSLAKYLWYDYHKLFFKYSNFILISFLIFLVGCAFSFWEITHQKSFIEAYLFNDKILPENIKTAIDNHKMWTDTILGKEVQVSIFIAINNLRVSALCFTTGVFFGLGSAFFIWSNGLLLGAVIAYCFKQHMLQGIINFLFGHSIFELLSIFISGGCGLALGYSLINPGELTRKSSFKYHGLESVKLFFSFVPLLIVAAIIEGNISPHHDINSMAKIFITIFSGGFIIFYLFFPRYKK